MKVGKQWRLLLACRTRLIPPSWRKGTKEQNLLHDREQGWQTFQKGPCREASYSQSCSLDTEWTPLGTTTFTAKAESLWYWKTRLETHPVLHLTANSGWFAWIKNCSSYHVKVHGEPGSADVKVAEELWETLEKWIVEEDYFPEKIFKMDKISLFCRCCRGLPSIEATSVPGFKAFKGNSFGVQFYRLTPDQRYNGKHTLSVPCSSSKPWVPATFLWRCPPPCTMPAKQTSVVLGFCFLFILLLHVSFCWWSSRYPRAALPPNTTLWFNQGFKVF